MTTTKQGAGMSHPHAIAVLQAELWAAMEDLEDTTSLRDPRGDYRDYLSDKIAALQLAIGALSGAPNTGGG